MSLDCPIVEGIAIARAVASHPATKGFKVSRIGDEAMYRRDGEPHVLEVLADLDKPVWLDFKFHDSLSTVVARIQQHVDAGLVQFVSIMAKGGSKMMEKSVAVGREWVTMIAVTELTSLSSGEVRELSGRDPQDSVLHLARLAYLAGVRHLVCSGLEVEPVHAALPDFEIYVPAIIPEWALRPEEYNQQRTSTPKYALSRGAAAIVLGRTIVDSSDPLEAVEKTAEEIEAIVV